VGEGIDGWPDWTGETVVCVGTGPSVWKVDLAPSRGRTRVFVIKGEYRHCPWADALYGLDTGWWVSARGAKDFKGLKFSPSPTAGRLFGDVRQVRLKPRAEILTGETGVIGCGLKTGGGHSGFHVMNLGVQFGARRLLLVGYDMTGNGRRNAWEEGVGKFNADRVRQWREALEDCAPQFARLGVEVINCSPGSALQVYPQSTLEQALGG